MSLFPRHVSVSSIEYWLLSTHPVLDTHTPVSPMQSKYCTSATGCVDKNPRNPINYILHEQLLFYFINTAVYNNLLSKPVIF